MKSYPQLLHKSTVRCFVGAEERRTLARAKTAVLSLTSKCSFEEPIAAISVSRNIV